MNMATTVLFTLSLPLVVSLQVRRIERQTQIAWSEWGKWGKCSHQCDLGVRRRDRVCVVPPAWSGSNQRRLAYVKRHCANEHSQYRTCNAHECSNGKTRESNPCATYNRPGVQWMPYEVKGSYRKSAVECVTYCLQVGGSQLIRISSPDGTHCKHETSARGICVAKQCQPVGCDLKLGSRAMMDDCGVCNGNGKDCEMMSKMETYRSSLGALGTYVNMVVLPAGSRTIHVEKVCSGQYLALKEEDGHYCVNGERRIGPSVSVTAGGTSVDYVRTGRKEMIKANGPTTSQLTVSVISIQPTSCNISYSFAGNESTMKAMKAIESRPASVEGIPERSQSDEALEKTKPKKPPCRRKCTKVKGQIERYCSSDYVIRGKIVDKTTSGFCYKYDVHVVRAYKGGLVSGFSVQIYTETLCNCPKFQLGEEYLMMGSHLRDSQRAVTWMIGEEDYNRPWREKWDQRMPQIAKRCPKQLANI
eukprot:m.2907 g.2907  ORF g.2907 m.2907 type:complete len:474 (+) comp8969_c0_seq2:181-1602(+)